MRAALIAGSGAQRPVLPRRSGTSVPGVAEPSSVNFSVLPVTDASSTSPPDTPFTIGVRYTRYPATFGSGAPSASVGAVHDSTTWIFFDATAGTFTMNSSLGRLSPPGLSGSLAEKVAATRYSQ